MDKVLIEMQKGCKATCVVILQEDVKDIKDSYNVKVDESDSNMLLGELNRENLENNLEPLAKQNNMAYLVIEDIDKIDEKKQEKYIEIVKDREFRGYKIPENVIIIFTVQNKENIQKIAPKLYHFCTVAI